MLDNFSFIIPKQLAGMARPGSYNGLEHDLKKLVEEGIGAIVSLTESPPKASVIEAAGLVFKHIPIRDFAPPTTEQIDLFINFAKQQIQQEQRAVVVHCTAGQGRTGTMLACYLVAIGESAEEAIESVRTIRPGSIETREQEACIKRYEERQQNALSTEEL